MATGDIDDQVVALTGAREVLPCAVDDAIRSELARLLKVARADDRSHLGRHLRWIARYRRINSRKIKATGQIVRWIVPGCLVLVAQTQDDGQLAPVGRACHAGHDDFLGLPPARAEQAGEQGLADPARTEDRQPAGVDRHGS